MAISETQSLADVNLDLTSASKPESGFSLIELVIAIAILLTLGTAATRLLSASLNIRARENVKSSGIADAQRGINMMSREIANSGYGLSSNGIVASDSTSSAIRVRANLNAADKETTSATVTDKDEDIKYMLYT